MVSHRLGEDAEALGGAIQVSAIPGLVQDPRLLCLSQECAGLHATYMWKTIRASRCSCRVENLPRLFCRITFILKNNIYL